MAVRPRAILTDIEGTTTPIAFVHDVLFPYARTRLAAFLHEHQSLPEVREALAQTGAAAPGQPPLATLLAWMDQDAKATPLKTLQGLIWHEGYQHGELQGRLYPDVAPALRRWHAAGTRLYIYSSGSEAAQRLIFGHSDAGNLAPLFNGYFDTRIGAKRNPGSYQAIAAAIAQPPSDIMFLSDVEAELDAAALAGLRTVQLVRPQDGTQPTLRHQTVAGFDELGALLP